jgi:hypothetical protein
MSRRIVDLQEESLRQFLVNPISLNENSRAYELAYKALVTEKTIANVDAFDPICIDQSGAHEQHRSGETEAAPPVTIDPEATYRLQFDGSARKNPTGIAGAGMVIYDSTGNEVWCGWKFLYRMANNCAEYCALLLGLRYARSLGIRSLEVEGTANGSSISLMVCTVSRMANCKGFGATKAAMDEFDEIHLR